MAAASIETLGAGRERPDVVRQQAVQGTDQSLGGHLARQIEGGHLAEGVDAGVGAARTHDLDPLFASQAGQGGFSTP